MSDYTDVYSLRIANSLVLASINAILDSLSEEYKRIGNLSGVILGRVVPNSSESREPLLFSLPQDRSTRRCGCSKIVLMAVMVTLFVVGLYFTLPDYFPRLNSYMVLN